MFISLWILSDNVSWNSFHLVRAETGGAFWPWDILTVLLSLIGKSNPFNSLSSRRKRSVSFPGTLHFYCFHTIFKPELHLVELYKAHSQSLWSAHRTPRKSSSFILGELSLDEFPPSMNCFVSEEEKYKRRSDSLWWAFKLRGVEPCFEDYSSALKGERSWNLWNSCSFIAFPSSGELMLWVVLDISRGRKQTCLAEKGINDITMCFLLETRLD